MLSRMTCLSGASTSVEGVCIPGLPEDDEAVQLARLAQASGNSLESVLQFQYKAGSWRAPQAGSAGAEEEAASLDTDPYQDVRR